MKPGDIYHVVNNDGLTCKCVLVNNEFEQSTIYVYPNVWDNCGYDFFDAVGQLNANDFITVLGVLDQSPPSTKHSYITIFALIKNVLGWIDIC